MILKILRFKNKKIIVKEIVYEIIIQYANLLLNLDLNRLAKEFYIYKRHIT